MAIYLDEPLDDEPLFGIVARYLESVPAQPLKPMIRRLFGRRIIASYAAGELDSVARETTGCWHLSPAEIACDMTDFPYFASISTPERTKMMLEKVCGVSSLGVTKARPMTAWTTPWQGHRFCPACFREDKLIDGFPHWRRSHQLPGVIVCHLHNEVLWELDRYAGKGTMGYISPDKAVRLGMSPIKLRLTNRQKKNCQTVAQVSADLLKNSLSIDVANFPNEFRDFMIGASRYLAGAKRGICMERLINKCFGYDYVNKYVAARGRQDLADILSCRSRRKPIRNVIALSLMRMVTENPRLLADRQFADIYNYSKSNEIKIRMPSKRLPRFPCPSRLAKHGPGYLVRRVRSDLGRLRAACDCGMRFSFVQTAEGFALVRVSRWGPDYHKEMLRLDALGIKSGGIARRLSMPEKTVKNFLNRYR
ncbi:TPA: TniQ family protein [Burkholderia cepacia]|uniref:TniQ family protein n=1 Tax=Burkholderia cepacia TaxID=292 RepID=UPI001CF5B61A|nr:TniQ family protein [Burkholderia cepacia]MCA8357646.1 TniQ family protein [Burkholderia cepacia]HDR9762166.1 TniQ family protein [Burkholderia cepacia ATCC 25416]HDV6370436.1 TniQ family protein [Burkholderia cepacia]